MNKDRIFGFFIILFALVASFRSTAKENDRKMLIKANDLFLYEEYARALPVFLELYENDTANAELSMKLGICYLNGDKYRARSLSYLLDAAAAKDTIVESFYYLGQAYHLANGFEEAIEAYNVFKRFLVPEKNKEIIKEVDLEIERCKNGQEFFANKNKNVVIANIGKPISSSFSEYSPLIADNGNMLIFTYRGEGCKGGKSNIYGEKDEDGVYMKTFL